MYLSVKPFLRVLVVRNEGVRDAGNGNAAFENLNDDGRQRLEVPSNTNVNIPERRTFAEDVGGSKRRCVRQLDIAGPSQPMRDKKFHVSHAIH
ncbi:hypothetical protein Tco_1517577 [Tanacetum coccineum]